MPGGDASLLPSFRIYVKVKAVQSGPDAYQFNAVFSETQGGSGQTALWVQNYFSTGFTAVRDIEIKLTSPGVRWLRFYEETNDVFSALITSGCDRGPAEY